MARIQGQIDPDGLIVNVTIMLGSIDESDRQAKGEAIPQPLATIGLIDTGAGRTVIHPLVAQHFGLQSSNRIDITIPGQTTVSVKVHGVRLGWGHAPLKKPPFEIEVASYAPASNVLVLIGRDALDDVTMIYYGPGKAFSLRF